MENGAKLSGLTSLALLLTVACDSPRDRPTGLAGPLPATSVEVVEPENDQIIPSDSLTLVVVEAAGSIQAIDLVVKRVSRPDTILKRLTRFETLQPSVRVEIEFDVPHLLTGVHLEIRAVAVDAIGDRHESAPVFVQIIECDVFPLACREP